MSFSVLSLIGFVSMTSAVDVAPREGLTLSEALLEGKTELSTRVRYEDVSQSGDRGAQAATYRAKLSYETEPYYYLRAKIEGTHVGALPDDEGFNSGANGQLDDLLIPDPEQSFLSQYWLAYDVSNTLISYGRQKLELDQGRLIGVEDFRQGESSVSGLTVRNESLNFLRLRAGDLYRFESPLDDQIEAGHQSINGRYFNSEYRGFIHSLLSIYYLDLDNDSGNEAWDSRTWGLRFAGDIKNNPRIEYVFEFARQSGTHENPADYTENYFHVGLAATYHGIRVGGGQETLGGGANGFFVTPLADLHRYQGWSDQFSNGGLGNISGGIEDKYASLGYVWGEESSLSGLEFHIHYHEFSSNDNSVGLGDLGKEYDVELSFQTSGVACFESLSASLRFSDYQEENFGLDTQKSWVEFNAEF